MRPIRRHLVALTRLRAVALFGATLVGASLVGSPALATCGKDCRTVISTDFRSCKIGCPTGGAGRACRDEKNADSSQFRNMDFDHDRPPGLPVPVVLDGLQHVSPTADITGRVTATFGTCGGATVFAGQGAAFTIRVDGSTIDVRANDPDVMVVDGVTMPTNAMFEMYTADIASGRDPDQWSVAGQTILVLQALASSEIWERDAELARATPGAPTESGATDAWCKVVSIGAAGLLVAAGTGACLLVDATCAAGTAFTVGGLAVPCVVIIGACHGGVFIGSEGVRELVQHWWQTGEVPTTTTTTTTTSTTISGSTTTTTTVTTTTTSVTTTTVPPCRTAYCIITAALGGPECTGTRVPRQISRLLDRGIALSQQAALSRTPGRAKRLRNRAAHALGRARRRAARFAHERKPKLPEACATRIEAAVDVVLGGLLSCGGG